MSCTVFVWRACKGENSFGHASLLVKSPSHEYMSWWPGDNKFVLSADGFSTSMADDKKENKRAPDYASAPIDGLDGKKMIEYWNMIKKNKTRYNLLGYNCSALVLDVLKSGGLYEVFPDSRHIVSFTTGIIIEPADLKNLTLKLTDYKGEGSDITDFLFKDHFSTLSFF